MRSHGAGGYRREIGPHKEEGNQSQTFVSGVISVPTLTRILRTVLSKCVTFTADISAYRDYIFTYTFSQRRGKILLLFEGSVYIHLNIMKVTRLESEYSNTCLGLARYIKAPPLRSLAPTNLPTYILHDLIPKQTLRVLHLLYT